MPDHTLSWGPAERAQADKLLSTLAQLLAPVAQHLRLPANWQALRGCMKVSCKQSARWPATDGNCVRPPQGVSLTNT